MRRMEYPYGVYYKKKGEMWGYILWEVKILNMLILH